MKYTPERNCISWKRCQQNDCSADVSWDWCCGATFSHNEQHTHKKFANSWSVAVFEQMMHLFNQNFLHQLNQSRLILTLYISNWDQFGKDGLDQPADSRHFQQLLRWLKPSWLNGSCFCSLVLRCGRKPKARGAEGTKTAAFSLRIKYKRALSVSFSLCSVPLTLVGFWE